MPRILFLVNLLEDGIYCCHVRVEFASARQLQEFLSRSPVPAKDGWETVITKGPSRGYDGKPLHHADIRLSTRLALPESSPPPAAYEPEDFIVSDGQRQVDYATGTNDAEQRPEVKKEQPLTWEQRASFQKASKALLQQLGVPCEGRWK